MMNNDPRMINRQDVLGILGVTVPNGNAQINSVHVPLVNCNKLIVNGDVFISGFIRTVLKLSYGISFPDGSASAPSISFTSDPTSGIYYTGSGVGFTSGGVNKMTVGPDVTMNAPITTDGGANLILNPSGSAIDFSGKALINFSGISTNANRYEVVAPATVTTLNATPTLLYNVPTVIGSAYLMTTDVVAANVTDGSSIATFTLSSMVKNIGGVITISTPLSISSSINPTLAGADITHSSSGINVTVIVTGKAATTIKWFGATNVTRQLF
jgi:hypothetical protein